MDADLVFIGPNPANISGMSAKFYRVRGNPTGGAVVTWGRVGTSGQSMFTSLLDAERKIAQKRRKGYVDADGSVTISVNASPAPALTLPDRADIAAYTVMTFDRFVGSVARLELLELTTLPSGIRLFIRPEVGTIYAARRYEDGGFGLANLGPH